MPVQLAVIGLDRVWGERVQPVLSRLTNLFRIVGVHDPVAHRARRSAATLGCDVSEGFRVLIGRCDVEAVLLASPTWYGPLPLIVCCAERKPVLLTHPLSAAEVAANEKLQRRLAQCQAPVELALDWSWSPATQRLIYLVRERLGPPRQVEFTVSRTGSERNTAEEDTLQKAIYWLQLLQEHDSPPPVSLVRNQSGWSGTVGSLPFRLTFNGGVSGHAGEPDSGEQVTITVVAEQGQAKLLLPYSVHWSQGAEEHQERLTAEPVAEERALRHFYDVVAEGAAPLLGIEQAIWLARTVGTVTSADS